MNLRRLLALSLLAVTAGCGSQPITEPPGKAPAAPAMIPQTCPAVLKPVLATYVNDPFAPYWCRLRGGVVPLWGGCTLCSDHGSHLVCEVRLPGAPNEVSPHVLADEAQHLFGCVHVKAAP
jgi:hypothetical protein